MYRLGQNMFPLNLSITFNKYVNNNDGYSLKGFSNEKE